MKGNVMLRNRKRLGAGMLLFFILIGSLCSCRISNSSDSTFYERAEAGADETGDAYSKRMEAAYNDAFERLMDSEHVEMLEGDDLGDKLTRKVLGGYQRSYYAFRTLSPVICIASMALGIMVMFLSTQNKRIMRTGLLVFVIGIPVTILLIVFGVGIFNGIILY